LRALCAVAEGSNVSDETGVFSHSAKCVAAVLGDALQRLCILGGREGMPRSLGSVYGSLVARFLGTGCRGVESRVIRTPGVNSLSNGVAVSHDGSTLLVSDSRCGSDAVHTFCVHTGVCLRTIGSEGRGPLQFRLPCQVWVASDDFVFVADCENDRIQVLTPRVFDFHGFVGVGQLCRPRGVCGDDDSVIVSEHSTHRISVFRRGDGALLRRFGSLGRGNGQLYYPRGLCLVTGYRHVAVADSENHRISVFSLDGEFVRTMGVGNLRYPAGVACSAFDELVVADRANYRVVVFRASGEVLRTMGDSDFIGVAMRGSTIVAQSFFNDKCVVFA
jgi:DNA-binding beta-propeller fold protein YncE